MWEGNILRFGTFWIQQTQQKLDFLYIINVSYNTIFMACQYGNIRLLGLYQGRNILGDVIADTLTYLQCIYRGNSSTWKDAPFTKTIKTGSRYHSSEWYLLGSANPPTDIEDS